jgi:hypothetical protein
MRDALMSLLREVVGIFGPAATIVLAAILLGAALLLVYMLLRFGESGVSMLLPFLRETFQALREEPYKKSPAIRLELLLHCLFGPIFAFTLFASLLHALIPWVNHDTEQILFDAFVTTGIVTVALTCVSVTLSLRLK